MTAEDKELLIRDICARLPYGLKAKYYDPEAERTTWDEINDIYNSTSYNHTEVGIGQYGLNVVEVKPYLFPLSSMTEEQKEEYHYIVNYISPDDTENWAEGEFIYTNQIEQLLHFYHTNHLDYRGLIPKDLALDATGLNIY